MKVLNNFKHDNEFYACGEDAPKLDAEVMKDLKEKGLIGEAPSGKKRNKVNYDVKMEKGAKIKERHNRRPTKKLAKKVAK